MTLYRVRQSVVPVMRDNGTAGAGGRLGSLPGGNCAAALDQSGAAAGRYYCVGRSSRNRSGSNRRIASVFLRFLIIRIVELRHAAFIACMVAGRKILCKRFSTKSRMALESRADSGLDPLVTESHGGQSGMRAGTA